MWGGLVGDARGDSSTIGVVLMIGVAVVLAAVAFGTFAGLGQENLTEVPQATFDVGFDQGTSGGFADADASDGEAVVVTHESGDEVNWLYFHVYVDDTSVKDDPDLDFAGSNPTELAAGDSVEVVNTGGGNVLASGAEIRVTYENPNTDKTAVLAEAVVP